MNPKNVTLILHFTSIVTPFLLSKTTGKTHKITFYNILLGIHTYDFLRKKKDKQDIKIDTTPKTLRKSSSFNDTL